eukprot:6221959-Amphidinium_carterae.2
MIIDDAAKRNSRQSTELLRQSEMHSVRLHVAGARPHGRRRGSHPCGRMLTAMSLAARTLTRMFSVGVAWCRGIVSTISGFFTSLSEVEYCDSRGDYENGRRQSSQTFNLGHRASHKELQQCKTVGSDHPHFLIGRRKQ